MDIIESVKNAENEAQEIKDRAKAEAKSILSESEKASRADAEKIISAAVEDAGRINAKAKSDADEAEKEAQAKLKVEIEKLKANALNNLDKAVQKAVSLVNEVVK